MAEKSDPAMYLLLPPSRYESPMPNTASTFTAAVPHRVVIDSAMMPTATTAAAVDNDRGSGRRGFMSAGITVSESPIVREKTTTAS